MPPPLNVANPPIPLQQRGWFWELDGAATLGWVAHAAGELRVVRGRVWVTAGDAAQSDHVLGPGDALRMNAAQHLVVENWSRHDPARVEWLPQHSPAPRQLSGPLVRSWRLRGVLRALADGWRLRAH